MRTGVSAGAVLASAAFAHFDLSIRFAALLLSGGDRVGFTAIGSSVLVVFHPIVPIAVAVAFLCVIVWLLPKIFRILRSALKRV